MQKPTHTLRDTNLAAPLLSEAELALRWDKSIRTLQRWRQIGTGPAYLKIGESVFYRHEDVTAYEDACRREGFVPVGGRDGEPA